MPTQIVGVLRQCYSGDKVFGQLIVCPPDAVDLEKSCGFISYSGSAKTRFSECSH
jgi:hypothetical protein